jgi:hypothetical protein
MLLNNPIVKEFLFDKANWLNKHCHTEGMRIPPTAKVYHIPVSL